MFGGAPTALPLIRSLPGEFTRCMGAFRGFAEMARLTEGWHGW
jgi:hypothetical protein